MEHSTKMTLVPVEEANLTQLTELDSDLSNILKNKELTQEDKVKLYQTVLGKYMKYEEKVYPDEKKVPENIKVKHRAAKANRKNHPKRILSKTKLQFPKESKKYTMYTGKEDTIKNKWTTF